MRLHGAAALALTALLFPIACGGEETKNAVPPPGATSLKTIQVEELEYMIKPGDIQVDRPGVYSFHITNTGNLNHALEIEGHGIEAESKEIPGGSSADFRVQLDDPGDYELYCPIGDHGNLGMQTQLIVGEGPGGASTTTPSGGY
jgi:uncharacterized cupredoxin-like copper-binding protein